MWFNLNSCMQKWFTLNLYQRLLSNNILLLFDIWTVCGVSIKTIVHNNSRGVGGKSAYENHSDFFVYNMFVETKA